MHNPKSKWSIIHGLLFLPSYHPLEFRVEGFFTSLEWGVLVWCGASNGARRHAIDSDAAQAHLSLHTLAQMAESSRATKLFF